MGLMGVLGLWILGSPYNWSGLGCKFLQELKTEISILPSLRSLFFLIYCWNRMSKEELALQIKHMETQMNLLHQVHDKKRKELNNTISTLKANVKEQRDVESRLTHLELSLSQS